jgi:hypothetical protein
MKMDIGPAFSRRSFASGFVVLAFSVVPAFAGTRRRAGELHYLGKSSAAAGLPLTDAQSVRSYFTTGLAELILDDRAAATKQGESPVLNSDPFVGHSEWDISDVSVDVKDTAGFKTVGTVCFLNFGKPEKVALELLRSGNECASPTWNGIREPCGAFTGVRRLTTARAFRRPKIGWGALTLRRGLLSQSMKHWRGDRAAKDSGIRLSQFAVPRIAMAYDVLGNADARARNAPAS